MTQNLLVRLLIVAALCLSSGACSGKIFSERYWPKALPTYVDNPEHIVSETVEFFPEGK